MLCTRDYAVSWKGFFAFYIDDTEERAKVGGSLDGDEEFA